MRAFVAGATGVLGRRIVRHLAARGHTAVGLARNQENEEVIRSLGGEPRRGDLFDAESLAVAAMGSDVVIHAATKIPASARIRPADWAVNDRIRREGVQALLRAAANVGARQYIQQSIVWLARPPDGSAFDEDSTSRDPHRAYRSMIDGEAHVRGAVRDDGFATTVLRFGALYSADSAHHRRMAEGLVRRKLPIIGDGRALWRLIHAEDAAAACVAAAEAGKAGVWHVVDDEAVAVGAFLAAMAERIGARPPGHIPRWLARLVAGPDVVSFFTESTRTSAERIRRDLGWRPRFPSYREGLDEVVEAWRREGFPRA